MGRIDDAIAACDQVQRDGLNGKFASWADFANARDAAEREYRSALGELSIRAARRARASRCSKCGGAIPVTNRLDATGECICLGREL